MKHRLGISIPLVLLLALATACGSASGPPAAFLTVQGEQVIAVGQSAQIVARTANADTEAYEWTSNDPSIAAVTAAGHVTGIAPGETFVTARGLASGAEAAMTVTVVPPPDGGIPHYSEWRSSAHGNENATAFTIWEPLGEVPADCARCHSTHGFRDWLGDDGSPVGVVDVPAPTGSVVECVACHNGATQDLTTVTFPSGSTQEMARNDAVCMSCHGGRASGTHVDTVTAAIPPGSIDTPKADLRFVSTHYLAAGATHMGTLAQGGYHYEGRSYDGRFAHASPFIMSCTDCHNAHTLTINFGMCVGCHEGASDVVSVRGIRKQSSLTTDYDGDGDLAEGVDGEISGLLGLLLQAMQTYAADVAGFPIARRPDPTPSYHEDENGNGIVDGDEAAGGAVYAHWTVRLLRAAYNYDHVANDSGAFAHNAKYAIQLLHDSIADLNSVLPTPLPLDPAARSDPGHFDGSSPAFRHWDDEGEVDAACARCHGGTPGFTAYLETGTNESGEAPANGLSCDVCHLSPVGGALRTVEEVELPSGITVSAQGQTSNLCMVCHTGRESMSTIDAAIAAGELSFKNVHYLPAAAVLFGADGKVGYEYAGKSYAGRFPHLAAVGNDCLTCHGGQNAGHEFHVEANFERCSLCHVEANDVTGIRLVSADDYDGDGDTAETLSAEIDGLAAGLYDALQVAAAAAGNPVIYDAATYPYFFKDTDGNGQVDPGEAIYPNRYTAWTAAFMKAAHNYQISRKDPGAWAHNFRYVAQLLFDSMEDLGADVTGYVRPTGY